MRLASLGNQDRERKSKIDTEKWKEHAEYYNHPKNFKKEETSVSENLEDKLKHMIKGRPFIELHQMKETLIAVPTQAEYDTLMQLYECAGHTMVDDELPTDFLNLWTLNGAKTAITGSPHRIEKTEGEGVLVGIGCISIDAITGWKKITMQQYLKAQGITQSMIKDMNEWYDNNRPYRSSNG